MRTWRPWTDSEMEQAIAMKSEGYSHREIGMKLSRTKEAIKTALKRTTDDRRGMTQEQYNADAIIGSQRLFEAMLRLVA